MKAREVAAMLGEAAQMLFPSEAEAQLRQAYPTWEFTRQDSGPRVGELIATHPDVEGEYRAPCADRLGLALERPELERLRQAYRMRYRIRRTPSLWIATLGKDDGTEPTLMRDTAAELEAAMKSPGPRLGTWPRL